MADDEDNDLLNLLLDDDTSLSSTVFTSETKATKRRIRKQTRTMLQCVVCGDHAEGKDKKPTRSKRKRFDFRI